VALSVAQAAKYHFVALQTSQTPLLISVIAVANQQGGPVAIKVSHRTAKLANNKNNNELFFPKIM